MLPHDCDAAGLSVCVSWYPSTSCTWTVDVTCRESHYYITREGDPLALLTLRVSSTCFATRSIAFVFAEVMIVLEFSSMAAVTAFEACDLVTLTPPAWRKVWNLGSSKARLTLSATAALTRLNVCSSGEGPGVPRARGEALFARGVKPARNREAEKIITKQACRTCVDPITIGRLTYYQKDITPARAFAFTPNQYYTLPYFI